MTIFDILEKDHDEAKDVMEAITDAEGTEERSHLFADLAMKLTAHAEAEEEVFYARLRNEDVAKDLVLEADEEHRLAKLLLGELEKADIDRAWMAKFSVLKTNVEHHIAEEENMLFPKAKKVFSKDEQRILAEQFLEAKQSRMPVVA